MSSSPPVVLTFAASDPTGGAGLQADLLTLASLGCHPLSVVTAITVQDTRGVDGMLAIEPAWVARQARRVLEDMPVAAFKLGVLGSARNAEAVAAILAEHPRTPVVLDPVLASGRGDPLADEETVQALRSVAPAAHDRADAEQPGSAPPGARRAGRGPRRMRARARRSSAASTCSSPARTKPAREVINTLYDASGRCARTAGSACRASYHGSGCTLASAIAALLANGTGRRARRCGRRRSTPGRRWTPASRRATARHLPDRSSNRR